jgi:hypothetical protein
VALYEHPIRVGVSRARFGDVRTVRQLHPAVR